MGKPPAHSGLWLPEPGPWWVGLGNTEGRSFQWNGKLVHLVSPFPPTRSPPLVIVGTARWLGAGWREEGLTERRREKMSKHWDAWDKGRWGETGHDINQLRTKKKREREGEKRGEKVPDGSLELPATLLF